MRLVRFKITNYRNINESQEVPVDPAITCFVGKNESGKTNVLQALYRLNPVSPATFDVVEDYPRNRLRAYQRSLTKGAIHDVVVATAFQLDQDDLKVVSESYGPCIDKDTEVHLRISYDNKVTAEFDVDEGELVKFLTSAEDLPGSVAKRAKPCRKLEALTEVLGEVEEPDAATKHLHTKVTRLSALPLSEVIWDDALKDRCPKIMYFDEYQFMAGKANLQELANAAVRDKDSGLITLFELLSLAGVTPNDLLSGQNYEHHKANIESTANEITDDVFEYWKQNTELEVEFDVHRGSGQTDPSMFYVRIKNSRHRVTVPFDERSKGFVWFFSFMTAFRKIAEDNPRLIILLDEPGLSLHASAQGDLLRFMEDRLAPDHQVLYTTHSPFMVDSTKLERVRTVEDVPERGAVVASESLSRDSATVFPLQAALSYSLAQTLFLGPNCLLVEGPSDLLYIQVFTELLEGQGRTGLSEKWVITPVGGASKLSTFVSLIGANQLNLCVLMDYAKKEQQVMDELMKNAFLTPKKILMYRDFCGQKEADVEDMLSPTSYVELVKRAYPEAAGILEVDTLPKRGRIVRSVEAALKESGHSSFSHLRPARKAVSALGSEVPIDEDTLKRFEDLFQELNERLES